MKKLNKLFFIKKIFFIIIINKLKKKYYYLNNNKNLKNLKLNIFNKFINRITELYKLIQKSFDLNDFEILITYFTELVEISFNNIINFISEFESCSITQIIFSCLNNKRSFELRYIILCLLTNIFSQEESNLMNFFIEMGIIGIFQQILTFQEIELKYLVFKSLTFISNQSLEYKNNILSILSFSFIYEIILNSNKKTQKNALIFIESISKNFLNNDEILNIYKFLKTLIIPSFFNQFKYIFLIFINLLEFQYGLELISSDEIFISFCESLINNENINSNILIFIGQITFKINYLINFNFNLLIPLIFENKNSSLILKILTNIIIINSEFCNQFLNLKFLNEINLFLNKSTGNIKINLLIFISTLFQCCTLINLSILIDHNLYYNLINSLLIIDEELIISLLKTFYRFFQFEQNNLNNNFFTQQFIKYDGICLIDTLIELENINISNISLIFKNYFFKTMNK